MSGLRSDPANGPLTDSLYIIVEITKDISIGLLAHWIYDRVIQYDAKHKRINGKEVVNESDFERVIGDDLQIGKND